MRDKPNYANCCTEPFWGKFFSFPSLPVPHCSEIGNLHLGLKFPFKEYQKEKKYHKEKKDSMNSEAIKVPKEPRLCNTELREDSWNTERRFDVPSRRDETCHIFSVHKDSFLLIISNITWYLVSRFEGKKSLDMFKFQDLFIPKTFKVMAASFQVPLTHYVQPHSFYSSLGERIFIFFPGPSVPNVMCIY